MPPSDARDSAEYGHVPSALVVFLPLVSWIEIATCLVWFASLASVQTRTVKTLDCTSSMYPAGRNTFTDRAKAISKALKRR